MNYEVITIKGEEYKLRLRAVDQIAVNKKLGKSLLEVVAEMQEVENPIHAFDLEVLLVILAHSLKAHHKDIKEKDVFDLYDAYVDEGNNMFELFQVIMKVLSVSGVLPDISAVMEQPQEVKGNLED